ncbi:hypothetical protein ACSFA3_21200 [Variovorax sp. RHLX14]|uniref:hypothetical protein n=1 Tax=Variovorax sp. RHLX14 TaxID=1259731 RepID=UPI003F481E89
MIEPPHPTHSDDIALIAAKSLLSAIPVAGNMLSELAGLYLNPMEQRKQQWMERVTDALNTIEERFNMAPGDLQSNPAFISLLYQATSTAIKNHRREKLEALQHGIVSCLDTLVFPEDTSHLFLRYVDELTVSHLALLSQLRAHEDELPDIRSIEQLYTSIAPNIAHAMEKEAFRLFIFDLDNRALIARGDLDDLADFESTQNFLVAGESKTRPLRLTEMGRTFLQFIADSRPL